MTLKSDLEELDELQAAYRAARDRVQQMKDRIIRLYCPLKEGDEVEVNGYTYKGKTMVVKKVFLKEDMWDTFSFVARGKVKRKDGTVGHQMGEWYSGKFSIKSAVVR